MKNSTIEALHWISDTTLIGVIRNGTGSTILSGKFVSVLDTNLKVLESPYFIPKVRFFNVYPNNKGTRFISTSLTCKDTSNWYRNDIVIQPIIKGNPTNLGCHPAAMFNHSPWSANDSLICFDNILGESVCILNPENGRVVKTFPNSSKSSWSPHTANVLSVLRDNRLEVYNVKCDSLIGSLKLRPRFWISSFRWDENEEFIWVFCHKRLDPDDEQHIHSNKSYYFLVDPKTSKVLKKYRFRPEGFNMFNIAWKKH